MTKTNIQHTLSHNKLIIHSRLTTSNACIDFLQEVFKTVKLLIDVDMSKLFKTNFFSLKILAKPPHGEVSFKTQHLCFKFCAEEVAISNSHQTKLFPLSAKICPRNRYMNIFKEILGKNKQTKSSSKQNRGLNNLTLLCSPPNIQH